MNKEIVIQKIGEIGVLPVVRTANADEAIIACRALVAGGINALEITLTIPNAIQIIEKLIKEIGDQGIIGAGSVLNLQDAEKCLDGGAQFVVSPAFNLEVVECCRREIAVMPGALTPTEIVAAWNAGADVVKVFPADAMGGARYLKAIKAPLPHIKLMPTGGVTLETCTDFIRAGAIAVGAGSDLVDLKLLRAGKSDEITTRAKLYLKAIQTARRAN